MLAGLLMQQKPTADLTLPARQELDSGGEGTLSQRHYDIMSGNAGVGLPKVTQADQGLMQPTGKGLFVCLFACLFFWHREQGIHRSCGVRTLTDQRI